jgi:DNA-binding response OmpR family regulator
LTVFNTPQSDMTPDRRAGGQPDSLPRKLNEVVIVDAECSRYDEMTAVAQEGVMGVHFCIDGRTALRLARQFRADAWVIAADLPDMPGIKLIELLDRQMQQRDVVPLRSRAQIPGGELDCARRPAMFLVSDSYRPEDEIHALAHGVSGYLVHPFSLETLLDARFWKARE